MSLSDYFENGSDEDDEKKKNNNNWSHRQVIQARKGDTMIRKLAKKNHNKTWQLDAQYWQNSFPKETEWEQLCFVQSKTYVQSFWDPQKLLLFPSNHKFHKITFDCI